ncbi:Hypothetical_protein [Hexamita inflata]|uniref:Hypothetical_protein n=1 Tax=Hexamita inflata TaxID=28002 RepID=A0AA86QIF0_9EUKA|nr:Hypothetical protein HINF_LOCUS39925 [Hexamita inflata]
MQAIQYFPNIEANFEHLFFNNDNKTNTAQLSLQSDSEHQTQTDFESQQRQRTESDFPNTTLECFRAYNATPLQELAERQESVAGTLPKAKTMAFEFELLYAIRLYFRDQRFESLREALIYHKQYHAMTNKKVHLNFRQLGQSCGISENQARNAFDTLGNSFPQLLFRSKQLPCYLLFQSILQNFHLAQLSVIINYK